MSIEGYISQLRRNHGIHVAFENGSLKVRATEKNMDQSVLSELKSRKADLISFFESLDRAESEIPKVADKATYKASSAQSRLYFVQQMDKESVAYNLPRAVHISGPLNQDQLTHTFNQLVARHESLRTYFHIENDVVVQSILPASGIRIEEFQDDLHEIESLIKEFIRPFDLSKGPLMRVGLVKLGAAEHVLLVDMHHIISDGFSQGILIKEFLDFYNKQALEPLALQYRDYAEWQYEKDQNKETKERQFWLNEFADEVSTFELPTDFARPVIKSNQGHTVPFHLTSEQTASLKALAAQERVTLFMVLLSAYNILLSKLSNQEEVVIGTPIAGRQQQEIEGLIGMFVNTLPIRNSPLSNLSFKEFLANVKTKILACFSNQSVQFEDLINDLKLDRNTSHNPLFDVMFTYLNFEEPALEVAGLTLKPLDFSQSISKFDMTLRVESVKEEINLSIEYASDLFQEETINRFITYFDQVVSAIIADSSISIADIEVLSDNEKEQLLKGFNTTETPYPDQETIISLFQKQVKLRPEKLAVVSSNERLTYAELDVRSNQIAYYLTQVRGVRSGDMVGVMLEREAWLIPSIYGILKAGAVYVPIDPTFPAERINTILKASMAKAVVTRERYTSAIHKNSNLIINLDETEVEIVVANTESPDTLPQSTDLAYVIYTSGSTGTPKGVMIEHHAVINRLLWMQKMYPISQDDVILQKTPIVFDVSVWELFWWSFTGASLCLLKTGGEKEPREIIKAIDSAKVTTMHFVPSMLSTFLAVLEQADVKKLQSLKQVFTSGEALKTEHVQLFGKLINQPYNTRLINLYGPTEATVDVSYYECDFAEIVNPPIGKPIDNTTLYILSQEGKLQPLGVPGELHIGGVQLARGYVGDKEQTAEKFIPDHLTGKGRLYKTGDLAKWLPDGNIAYLGRIDHQVKIRGFRIELGEIESQLLTYAGIDETVVIARSKDADKILAAYFVSKEAIQIDKLRSHVASKLPSYMVPPHFVQLESMPLSPTGKINRKALPTPEVSSQDGYIAPATEKEQQLVQVWEAVLGLESIGVTDNFFSIGGDSIKSIQIGSRLRGFGYEVTVQDIFTHQNIRQLAANLRQLTVVSDQSVVEGESELSPIQHWFFKGGIHNKQHFNQSVLLNFPDGLSLNRAKRIFTKLQAHHDALRLVFSEEKEVWRQKNLGLDLHVSIQEFDLRDSESAAIELLANAQNLQSDIDLDQGPLMKLGLFHQQDGTRLLIVIHHLVTDGVSWRILLEDIGSLYQQLGEGEKLSLPLKTDSYLSWVEKLNEYRQTPTFTSAKAWWQSFSSHETQAIPRDFSMSTADSFEVKKASFRLDQSYTKQLLSDAHGPFHTQVNDLLLAALLHAAKQQYEQDSITVSLEGHGRETIQKQFNISRTVGWFTSIYPVTLRVENNGLTDLIKQVKESLRQVPNHGFDYLLCQYFEKEPLSQAASEILFNYLGQFDADMEGKPFVLASEAHGNTQAQGEALSHDWEINGLIKTGYLEMSLQFEDRYYSEQTIQQFMSNYRQSLETLIDHCSNYAQEEKTPSDLSWKGLSMAELDEIQELYAIEDAYTLSPMQEGMLFHSLLGVSDSHYVGQITCQICGKLDIEAIEYSMNQLMGRYDILRTVFLHQGYERPLQVVLKERKVDFAFEDIRQKDKNQFTNLIHLRQLEEQKRSFDLGKDVLMRLLVLQTGDERYEFIWSHHHILMDGWCMGIIVKEFEALYTAQVQERALDLAAVKPYANYITWLEDRDTTISADYWTAYLAGYSERAILPQKDSLLAEALPDQLESCFLNLSKEETSRLHQLSASNSVTLNTIFQFAWGLILSRYNNTQDVAFGSVVSGRPAEIEGIESMVGLFINTIPVRIQSTGEASVSSSLKALQKQALAAETHHYHPLSEVQAVSELGGDLIDHILVFENFPVAQQIEAGETTASDKLFTIHNGNYAVQTNYDLSIKVYLQEALEVQFDYNGNRYETGLIERVTSQLKNVLMFLAREPESLVKEVSIYDKGEQAHINESLTKGLALEEAPFSIQQQFQLSFDKHADKRAIEYNGQHYSYQQLEALANKVAHTIQLQNLPECSTIGVLCEDKYLLIASILGILKARMTFVPLEVSLPDSRLISMLEQTEARCVITDQLAASLEVFQQIDLTWCDLENIRAQREIPLAWDQSYAPNDPVYVYFTSGSTGKPKGVLGRNEGLSHFVSWEISEFEVDHSFRFSQFTNPGFDVFMRDVFVPLCAGATICIPSEDEITTGQQISDWLTVNQISFIHCVPSFFKLFNDTTLTSDAFADLRYILLAGEKIAPFELKKWYQSLGSRIQLVNIYGPTETTLAKGFYCIQPEDSERAHIPVMAIPGAQFLMLDQHNNLCPPQAIGEIYIRTPYRSLGYLAQSQVQSNPFTQSPFSSSANDIIYKTGDMGRITENGEVEILGRADHQIKIRGIRIELDDIKENLLSYESIRDAVVTARTDEDGEKFICAYLVSEATLDLTKIRAFLSDHLPRNMVPAFFIPLTELPLLPNGKVNRKALPEPEISVSSHLKIAASPTEADLIEVWSHVLKLDQRQISTDQSFFDLGGHSIRAVSLINHIRQKFDVSVKLRDVFEHNTIESQARFIDNHDSEPTVTDIPRVADREVYPASPAQERMYYQHLLHNESTAFNISIPIRITEQVDLERIKSAFQQVVDKHTALRTSIILTDHGVVQKINELDFQLEFLETDHIKTAQAHFLEFIRPFDLSTNSLFRCGLLHHETEGNLLFVDLHHMICDGVSLNILINDFKKAYGSEALAPLNLRYVDYACWVSEQQNDVERQKAFWIEKLSGELPRLNLHISDGENSHKTAFKLLSVDTAIYQQVRDYTAQYDVSEYMILMSAYYIFLSKISGNEDVLIGTDGFGRTQPALKDVIGTFVNILPVRLTVDAALSVADFLKEVRACVLEAFENQDFQFDQMISWLKANQSLEDDELVEFHCSFANALEAYEIEGLEYLPIDSKRNQVAEYGFSIEGRVRDGNMSLSFIYNQSLYDEETVNVFAEYFYNILKELLKSGQTSIEDINLESLVEETT